MFRQFGWLEILIILLIALLIFGPSKLPQLARSIGKTIREFQRHLSGAPADEEAAEQPADEKDKS